MAVFNDLPPPDEGCQEYLWQAYVADGFAWEITGVAGPNTVYAYVRDAYGYCSRPVSASIVYDTTGPVVDQLALVVHDAAARGGRTRSPDSEVARRPVRRSRSIATVPRARS